eukprot:6862483-Pyramimonas_sp.AAC.1
MARVSGGADVERGGQPISGLCLKSFPLPRAQPLSAEYFSRASRRGPCCTSKLDRAAAMDRLRK